MHATMAQARTTTTAMRMYSHTSDLASELLSLLAEFDVETEDNEAEEDEEEDCGLLAEEEEGELELDTHSCCSATWHWLAHFWGTSLQSRQLWSNVLCTCTQAK